MNSVKQPTYLDYYEITHWSWACCYQGERYLHESALSNTAFEKLFNEQSDEQTKQEVNLCQAKQNLAAYDFMSALGILLKILPRTKNLFPQLEKVIANAQHIQKEGRYLRNMLEHAHDDGSYLRGGGHYPQDFIRHTEFFSADATSTVITEEGHLLGGRLLVERALSELYPIYEAAQKISPPKDG